MRALACILIIASCAMNVAAQSPGAANWDCLQKKLQNAPLDCPLTVLMTDSTYVRGVMPLVMSTPSAFYIRPIVGQDIQGGVFIPYSKINSVTYTKPSPIRYGVVLMGLGAGAWAGAAIGVASAPEGKGFMDFPQIPCGVIGGIIGGLVGAALGDQLSKGLKTTVTIRCP